MFWVRIQFTFFAGEPVQNASNGSSEYGGNMAVKVRIPTPLQTLTQGREEVDAKPAAVIDLVRELDELYPGILERTAEGGKIRKFINIYVNDEDIRFLQGEQTQVKDGDEVSIIPAIAGGCINVLQPEK
jgi:molybdopterin synthase sulfur carrier subunit